jgi:hypothetical protein
LCFEWPKIAQLFRCNYNICRRTNTAIADETSKVLPVFYYRRIFRPEILYEKKQQLIAVVPLHPEMYYPQHL